MGPGWLTNSKRFSIIFCSNNFNHFLSNISICMVWLGSQTQTDFLNHLLSYALHKNRHFDWQVLFLKIYCSCSWSWPQFKRRLSWSLFSTLRGVVLVLVFQINLLSCHLIWFLSTHWIIVLWKIAISWGKKGFFLCR